MNSHRGRPGSVGGRSARGGARTRGRFGGRDGEEGREGDPGEVISSEGVDGVGDLLAALPLSVEEHLPAQILAHDPCPPPQSPARHGQHRLLVLTRRVTRRVTRPQKSSGGEATSRGRERGKEGGGSARKGGKEEARTLGLEVEEEGGARHVLCARDLPNPRHHPVLPSPIPSILPSSYPFIRPSVTPSSHPPDDTKGNSTRERASLGTARPMVRRGRCKFRTGQRWMELSTRGDGEAPPRP